MTAKGGLVKHEYVDWVITRPYLALVLINLIGVCAGIWRMIYGPQDEVLTVVVSLVWVAYNLLILGGAVAVSVESKQIRQSNRVEIALPAALAREDGHLFPCVIKDYSESGVGIQIKGNTGLLTGQQIYLLLDRGQQSFSFPARVIRISEDSIGLQMAPMSTRQHIDFIQCTFARADTWALWQDSFPQDKPLESLIDILKLGFRGYRHLAEFGPVSLRYVFRSMTALIDWVVSFIPRRVVAASVVQRPGLAIAQQQ